MDDITSEREVYAKLHQRSVPNIPYCSHAGDVSDDTYYKSRTHEFLTKYNIHLPEHGVPDPSSTLPFSSG